MPELDHDLLLTLSAKVQSVLDVVNDIKAGKTENCVMHTQRLNNHWTHIKALWGVLGVMAAMLVTALFEHIFKGGKP